ncbi:LysR family transcriptional regulator [Rhizobium lusitanum]|uniref:HTH-type transcriptional regulator TtuA n=1 Tax=Rhizobium lusitanum TaxID=293958 RepID=A0A7X0MDP3_9HYPH|nr:LysR family transcriptional regulator [Rhizobium lusitanum]MBB6487102.1 DNA-binding transcriptional LysR family regulator [Rhizobium lusitanum]
MMLNKQQWPEIGDLDELMAFAAVAERLSFVQAAAALGRDATVLSRRVTALERRLNVRLLERTTRKVSLTEAGFALFERLRVGFSELREAEFDASQFASGAPNGRLRLTLPSTFGRMWVAPRLPEFLARYPEVSIEAEYSNRYSNLLEGGFDVAIRIGDLVDSSLVASRIANHSRLLCAAPAYLDRFGLPKHPEDLIRHICLGFTGFAFHPNWRFVRGADGERITVRVKSPYLADDAEALVEAAIRGSGIMMATNWLVEHRIARNELVQVLADWDLEGEGAIFVVVPSGRLLAGKTRAFLDWAKGLFAPVAPWKC